MSKSAKGSDFERELCKLLSKWWTKGERDDVFWRTSQSGGRATQRRKAGKSTYGSCGDLATVDPIGTPLTSTCTIELKRGYSYANFADIFEMRPDSAQHLWEAFIEQAMREARDAGVPHWLLIVRRDSRKAIICFPKTFWKAVQLHADPTDDIAIGFIRPIAFIKLALRSKDTKSVTPFVHIGICPLDQFLQAVSPKTIISIHKSIG